VATTYEKEIAAMAKKAGIALEDLPFPTDEKSLKAAMEKKSPKLITERKRQRYVLLGRPGFAREKKIDGKTFTAQSWHRTKTGAEKSAKKLRNMGMRVRILKERGVYIVWGNWW